MTSSFCRNWKTERAWIYNKLEIRLFCFFLRTSERKVRILPKRKYEKTRKEEYLNFINVFVKSIIIIFHFILSIFWSGSPLMLCQFTVVGLSYTIQILQYYFFGQANITRFRHKFVKHVCSVFQIENYLTNDIN